VGIKDRFFLPWVKWKYLVAPKILEGRGLENIFLFSKYLVAKSCWRMITIDNLLMKLVTKKYVCLNSILEWIGNLVK
jgi:hypothetical protein